MNRTLAAALAAFALVAPLAVQAQPAQPDLDDQVRCAALFAIVANEQRRSAPGADRFPPMAETGRDFFVETGLRLIKERKMGEDALKPYFVDLIGKIQKEYADTPNAGTKLDGEIAGCLEMKKVVVLPKPLG